MFPFALYLATGLIVGLHVFILVAQAIWGAPTHPTQYITFGGALGLALASFLALFWGRLGGLVAFPASVLCWMFYLPATLRTSRFTSSVLILGVAALGLLIGTTVHGWLRIRRRQVPLWAFPIAASRPARRWTLIGTTAVVATLAIVNVVAVGNRRTVTEEATWSIGSTTNKRGDREIELRYVRFPRCFQVVYYSKELQSYLETLPDHVPVTMVVVSSFGKTRSIQPGSIGSFQGSVRWVGGGQEGDDACPW